MLGGLSIAVWAILVIFSMFRGDSELLESRFLQIPIVFAWLSFFCNFPHFMVSYKIAYSRKKSFILDHWFQLLFVPALLIGLYLCAYLFFHLKIENNLLVTKINEFFSLIHLSYRFGVNSTFGAEMLILSIRLMYILVGWHYAKQVFGCILITLRMDQIQLKQIDRNLLKYTLFSVAIYNFFFSSIPVGNASSTSYFYNLPIEAMGFSPDFLLYSKSLSIIMSLLLPAYLYLKYRGAIREQIPMRAIVVYLAFIIWWLPPVRQLDYSLYAIPFFHSLQYLLFAAKIEGHHKMTFKNNFIQVLVLIVAGFLFFEFVPNLLDISLKTIPGLGTIFFYIAFPVFINIHHFFIDNCIWKVSNHEVKEKIFE